MQLQSRVPLFSPNAVAPIFCHAVALAVLVTVHGTLKPNWEFSAWWTSCPSSHRTQQQYRSEMRCLFLSSPRFWPIPEKLFCLCRFGKAEVATALRYPHCIILTALLSRNAGNNNQVKGSNAWWPQVFSQSAMKRRSKQGYYPFGNRCSCGHYSLQIYTTIDQLSFIIWPMTDFESGWNLCCKMTLSCPGPKYANSLLLLDNEYQKPSIDMLAQSPNRNTVA